MAYLELGEGLPGNAPMIRSLPEMRATLDIAFHKTDAKELAEHSPLIQHVLQLGKERKGWHTVSVPQLSGAMGVSFVAVQEQLSALASAGEVSYTSSDRALCFEARLSFPRACMYMHILA